MSFRFNKYFVKKAEDIPDNYILFGSIPVQIGSWSAYPDVPIYFNKAAENKIQIIQEGNTNAIFYRSFSYYTALMDLLSGKDSGSVLIHARLAALVEFSSELSIDVYICREKLEQMYTTNKIPSLLQGMVIKLSAKSTRSINIVNTVIVPGQDVITLSTKKVLFPHQHQNVSWMVGIERCPPIFDCPQIPDDDHLYKIESINDSIVLRRAKRKWKFISTENLKHLKIVPRGGVLADEVGLGKTCSFIGLMVTQPVRCTLVICPGQICKQWKSEIEETSDLSSWIVAGYSQFKKIDTELEKFQVIICPYSILRNARCADKFLTLKWDRVIFDEIHEFLPSHKYDYYTSRKKHYLYDAIQLVANASRFCWLCTGTLQLSSSIIATRAFQLCCSALCTVDGNETMTNIDYKELLEIRTQLEPMAKQLVALHTKDSLTDHIQIPPVVFNNIMLTQSPTERAIYDSALGNTEEMIRLCTHVLVSEQCSYILGNQCVSLAQVHAKMLTYYNDKVKRLTRKLELATMRLQQNAIDELTCELKSVQAKSNILSSLEKTVAEDNCGVCLEQLDTLTPAVAICGHIFCSTCISQMFGQNKQQINCPFCREKLKKTDFNMVAPPTPTEQEASPTMQWGTKMAAIIEYLNTTLEESGENRIIIFSRWNTMLRLIAEVLEKSDIAYTLVKGSAFQASASIRRFKMNPNIRIILLSSEKASAGTNLTEASHLVLVDTVNNSPLKARSLEEQAVGRTARLGQTKTVQVSRFIMSNTIEEENYHKMIACIN